MNTGAICAYSNSTVLVLGETYWAYNDAARNDESGGGAIYFSGSSLLSIEGTASMWRNVAVYGGAIFWRGESFFNVTGDGEVEFYENGARFGGAIAGRSDNMEEPVLILSLAGRATFFNNTARQSGGAVGVLLEGSVDIVGEAIFSQNAADETGGAVAFAAAGHLTISENATVTFMENTCEGSGGGIAMWGSDGLYIESKAVGVSFAGNTAGDAGGAIYLTTMGSVNLYGASFADNQATNLGGAVRIIDTENLSIGDLDFSSNTARIGGALVVESSRLGSSSFEADLNANPGSVSGCYFSNNTAVEDGGALHVGSGSLNFRGSTFVGNTAGDEQEHPPSVCPFRGDVVGGEEPASLFAQRMGQSSKSYKGLYAVEIDASVVL